MTRACRLCLIPVLLAVFASAALAEPGQIEKALQREHQKAAERKGVVHQLAEREKALASRLNVIEAQSPGTKSAFYFEYLDKAAHLFNAGFDEDQEGLLACQSCGAPTPGDVCAFCRLVEKAAGATPVVLGDKR